MTRALLVGAAPCEHKALTFLLEQVAFDYVIAVDGGYQTLLEKKVYPDVVFGDFDSLGFVPDQQNVEAFDPHKDFTDMDLALKFAAEQNFDDLVMCDAFVGRLDHTLGNLQLLISAASRGMRVWGFTEEEGILALYAPGNLSVIRFDEGAFGTFSLISHADVCEGVNEAGFEWSLSDATVLNRAVWGVSNELIGTPAIASCEQGSLWAFYPLAEFSRVLYGKDGHRLI